jgi:hypothetical protein
LERFLQVEILQSTVIHHLIIAHRILITDVTKCYCRMAEVVDYNNNSKQIYPVMLLTTLSSQMRWQPLSFVPLLRQPSTSTLNVVTRWTRNTHHLFSSKPQVAYLCAYDCYCLLLFPILSIIWNVKSLFFFKFSNTSIHYY